MARKSLAEELYEKAEDTVEEDCHWIVLYDFNEKPHTNFWRNLKRLTTLEGDSYLIQFSAFYTDKKRVAVAVKDLAGYYGAKTEVFKGRIANF